jgi:hypothetical protein
MILQPLIAPFVANLPAVDPLRPAALREAWLFQENLNID